MGSRRTHRAGGSAEAKPTDLTPKRTDSHRAIESEKTDRRAPIKTGRNMGGRNILGERDRGPQGSRGL